jgi:hypothetical protein
VTSSIPGARGRQRVNRVWAWAAFAAIPVWLVLAVGLLVNSRQPPPVVQVADSSQLSVDDLGGNRVVDNYSLYVTPADAAETVSCREPRRSGDQPIERTEPDRAATATRTVDGVSYGHYGKVYSLTSEISCSSPASGLLLTEFDGDHRTRYFALLLIALCPILALIAVRILRRRPA